MNKQSAALGLTREGHFLRIYCRVTHPILDISPVGFGALVGQIAVSPMLRLQNGVLSAPGDPFGVILGRAFIGPDRKFSFELAFSNWRAMALCGVPQRLLMTGAYDQATGLSRSLGNLSPSLADKVGVVAATIADVAVMGRAELLRCAADARDNQISKCLRTSEGIPDLRLTQYNPVWGDFFKGAQHQTQMHAVGMPPCLRTPLQELSDHYSLAQKFYTAKSRADLAACLPHFEAVSARGSVLGVTLYPSLPEVRMLLANSTKASKFVLRSMLGKELDQAIGGVTTHIKGITSEQWLKSSGLKPLMFLSGRDLVAAASVFTFSDLLRGSLELPPTAMCKAAATFMSVSVANVVTTCLDMAKSHNLGMPLPSSGRALLKLYFITMLLRFPRMATVGALANGVGGHYRDELRDARRAEL